MKGTTKITLIDAKTKEVKKEYIDENCISPLYQDLIQRLVDEYFTKTSMNVLNSFGTEMQPKNWMNGIALLEDVQAETNYTPKGKILGFGGSSSNVSANNIKYGDRIERTDEATYIKQKWQFPEANANGTIRCLSLGRYDRIMSGNRMISSIGAGAGELPWFIVNKDRTKRITFIDGKSVTFNDPYVPTVDSLYARSYSYGGSIVNDMTDRVSTRAWPAGFWDDDYLYVIGNDVANNDYRTLFKIDTDTMEIVTKHYIDAIVQTSSLMHMCSIHGDYIYFTIGADAEDNMEIGRINLSLLTNNDPATVELLDIPKSKFKYNNTVFYFTFINDEQLLMEGYSGTVSSSGSYPYKDMEWMVIDTTTFTIHSEYCDGDANVNMNNSYPCYTFDGFPVFIGSGETHTTSGGIWGTTYYYCNEPPSTSPTSLSIFINNLAMLTINNLETPIVKTDQEILHVEYLIEF